MNTRSIRIALITAGLATAPVLGVAADSAVAMDSCVKAFMAKLSTTMPKTPKLRAARFIDDRLNESSNAWTLMARDAQDNHPIARVLCTVNALGQVIDLQRQPL
jgi:hypothetical protein